MSDKKPTRYWTYDKCLEMAKKCHSKSELRKLCSSALNAAMKNGWINDYTWFETLWAPRWNEITCHEEASKYSSRGEFKKYCPTGYKVAREKKWLETYTWFEPVTKAPAGYWTYKRCYLEAKKYKTKEDFRKSNQSAARTARKNGWIKDYIWFEEPFHWTKSLCEMEARKYSTKRAFRNGNGGAYIYAHKHGLLNSFDWFEELKKPKGYWTKERCEEEARKYKTKGEFVKGCSSAHHAAVVNGWLDDYDWFIDQRLDVVKGKIDSVYVYVFEDTKVAYVGRTLMRRQKKRDKEHIFNLDNDNVAKYAMKMNIPVPPMQIIESGLTLKEGLDREDYWRKWYEQQGYTMLNRLATGIGKGSLGGISHGKWNRKSCYEEAKKYKSATEFEKNNGSAYEAARRNEWLKDYDWFDVLWEAKWSKEACYEEAKKYQTRGDFEKGSHGAYRKALEKGWINKYEWLTSRQTKPSGYWDNYENCFNEAKKYTTRRTFQKGCMGAYLKALKNGWLDDYTWFVEKYRTNYWNYDTCLEEAKKYTSKKEFKKYANGAYQFAYNKGWLDDYTWFKPLTGFWTYDACKLEAAKYKKRSHFKEKAKGAYAKSRINGWLDDFFPKDE